MSRTIANRRTQLLLWCVGAALAVLSGLDLLAREVAGVRSLGRLRRFFALSAEANLPTWWSTCLLLAGAALCAWLAWLAVDDVRAARRWRPLAAILAAMSLVEATQLRESLLASGRDATGASGLLHFVWVVPGGILAAVVVASFLPFVLRLRPALRTQVLAAGAVYVLGALGLEMLGGVLVSGGATGLPFTLAQEVEEVLELVGLTLLVTALLGEVRVRSSAPFAIPARPFGRTGRPEAAEGERSTVAAP